MPVTTDAKAAEVTERVDQVRARMKEAGLDGILIRSTDRHLNEYVPLIESTRAWVTGFTGSAGEAFLGHEEAWVSVDGRYYLQADDETDGTPWSIDRVPLGTSLSGAVLERVKATKPQRIGYEPDRVSVRELESIARALEGIELVPTLPSLVEQVRGPIAIQTHPVRSVLAQATGRTVAERVAEARETLERHDLAGTVVQRLDSLAYLTNLRGRDLPFQATFRGLGLLLRDGVVLATDATRLPHDVADVIEVVAPDAWAEAVPAGARIGYDPSGTTADVVDALRARGAEPVAITCPLTAMKAKKTDAELAAMRDAFRRADRVVEQAIDFVAGRIDAGERVTEADLSAEVERLFLASGAVGLSFRVIAAAGANGAHIHYSHPDPERAIQPDELVLLDTGGYYQEGYATDLTRTFLAGSPDKAPEASDEQRRMFTLVLKAAVAGMSARIPVGGRGDQLDAIVRAPLWAAGCDYMHGTGHGVGINVHEAPPRVSTKGAIPVEEGHVFSIEPGLYTEGVGGVRIENLCTVAPAHDAPGFLDVVPLTFAKLDERLIDDTLLNQVERTWLERYRERREDHLKR